MVNVGMKSGTSRGDGRGSRPRAVAVGAGALIGFERRLLEREASADADETALARLALTRRYAVFAREAIAGCGGDADGLRALTDRDNMVPLGDGSRPVR